MALLAAIRRLVRTAVGVTPTLDLHGLGVRDALAETERFLRDAQAHGLHEVRIVYGKGHGSPGGRGVLRDVVPHWLDTDGAALVTGYQRQPDASGADGGALVFVQRMGNDPVKVDAAPRCGVRERGSSSAPTEDGAPAARQPDPTA